MISGDTTGTYTPVKKHLPSRRCSLTMSDIGVECTVEAGRVKSGYGAINPISKVHQCSEIDEGRVARNAELDENRSGDEGSRIVRTGLLAALTVALLFGLSASGAGWRSLQDIDDGGFEGKFEAVESMGELTLEASNEYGAADRYALALYGFDTVAEPFRETTIHVTDSTAAQVSDPGTKYRWLLLAADDDGKPYDGSEPVAQSIGGSRMKIELEEPGGSYFLLVQQVELGGKRIVAEGRVTVRCKYVRRELRQLTDKDRVDFFEALRIFYTISIKDGTRMYGEDFNNYVRMVAIHNSKNFCYHNGMQFVNAHAAFDLVTERSLQLINPRIALPYWDFMIEAGTLGAEWPNSPIFGHDMMGSAVGNPENDYQITDGWFANITSILDVDGNLVDPKVNPGHNMYNYIAAEYDYTDLKGVVRSHSFCGLQGEFFPAQCIRFIGCFEESDTAYGWAHCMEENIDMGRFMKEHPEYSRGLLTFALEYIIALTWSGNTLMSQYNTCDTSCVHGQETPCKCTCETNPYTWTDEEVRSFMESSLQGMMHTYQGDLYIDLDHEAPWTLGFMQYGKRLPEEQTQLLLRTLMVVSCEPGSLGAMTSAASPLDPIFWVLHPIFEKGHHVVELSPRYADRYEFDWVSSTCYGSDITDELPFTEQALGFGDGVDFLTNEDLMRLLSPKTNSRLTYMYDHFQSWGTCSSWDPCPECTDNTRVKQERS